MDKPNVFKSSSFYMDSGDILHMLFLDETGVTIDVDLWSAETTTETVPDAPTILDVSDITDSSFTVNWYFNENTTGYYLDVATDSAFTAMVAGYNNLDVGNVNGHSAIGFVPNITYYCRIRAYNSAGVSTSSEVKTLTTDVLVADDWFLPSSDGLTHMYNNLKLFGVGGLANAPYWSSTELSATEASVRNFDNGVTFAGIKGGTCYVRAARSFTSIVSFALRDQGPTGGLIFHIDGATYYEASPTDVSSIHTWSNVVALAIGTTLASIAESQNNTNEIIAQAGHTDSAAKLCDDLIT